MKISKLINAVNIQELKLTAQNYNLTVTINDKPKWIKGKQKIINIKGNTDNILLFSREIKGLNPNSHLFSDISINNSGAIKSIKRAFKKGVYYNGKLFHSITDLKKFINETQHSSSVKKTKEYIIKKIIQ